MSGSAPAAITVAVLLAALGIKSTDLVKYVVALIRYHSKSDGAASAAWNDALNGLLALAVTGVAGFLVVQFLLKPSAWGDEVTIGAESLSELSLFSTFVFGLVFSAVASTIYDFKKAAAGQKDALQLKLVP